jgi:nitrogen fixation protein NifB
MSTNGLLLPEKIDLLEALNLCSVTVTLNALDPDVAGKIYSHVFYQGKKYTGREGAEILIANQIRGIEQAARFGMTVKVNTVLIPGLNDEQIPLIAKRIKELGATVMNIMPLIPQADFADVVPPSHERLDKSASPTSRSSDNSNFAASQLMPLGSSAGT